MNITSFLKKLYLYTIGIISEFILTILLIVFLFVALPFILLRGWNE